MDSIEAVHSLPREIAALEKPTVLRGIVTYTEPTGMTSGPHPEHPTSPAP